MCTAIYLSGGAGCFGRNLDLERSYGESPVLFPRNCPLPLHHLPALDHHASILGMARMESNFPLFFDAINEHGLAMAGLNFPDFCVYSPVDPKRKNLAPFELIPFLLGTCATLSQAEAMLRDICLCDTAFSPALQNTPLHFMLCSREGARVIERTADGLKIYANPIGVMTNSPPFPYHLQRLADFMGLSCAPAQDRFGGDYPLHAYSRGMGAIGLPGDLSSSSRFVRAAFARANSRCPQETTARVMQLFHLLDFVAFPRGSVRLADDQDEITVYSCCMDLKDKTYYYKTYDNSALTAVRMQDMDGDVLRVYPLRKNAVIMWEN